jgi:hypothetical protein
MATPTLALLTLLLATLYYLAHKLEKLIWGGKRM